MKQNNNTTCGTATKIIFKILSVLAQIAFIVFIIIFAANYEKHQNNQYFRYGLLFSFIGFLASTYSVWYTCCKVYQATDLYAFVIIIYLIIDFIGSLFLVLKSKGAIIPLMVVTSCTLFFFVMTIIECCKPKKNDEMMILDLSNTIILEENKKDEEERFDLFIKNNNESDKEK